MKKFYYPIFSIFIALFIIGCEKDESDSNSGSGSSNNNQNTGIQFSPDNKPIFTENKEYAIGISGGTSPYSITTTDIPSAYISNDSLKFINQQDTIPTLYGINIEDKNEIAAQFQFVSSPSSINLDLNNFTATARDSSDTTGVGFSTSYLTYYPKSDRFSFGSKSTMGYSDLRFSVRGIKSQDTILSNISFTERRPLSPPVFYGTFQLDTSKTQQFNIKYDNLRIPESFSFNLKLQRRDSLDYKRIELLTSSDVVFSY